MARTQTRPSRLWLVALVLAACAPELGPSARRPTPPPPPPTHPTAMPQPAAREPLPVETRREEVVDEIHGTLVPDPYRWLEDGSSAEVQRWTAAENAHTRAVLDAVPGREAIRTRLQQLLSIGTVGAPAVRKTKGAQSRYFHLRRDAEQDQPVLWVRDGVDGKDRALVDPNRMSADATTALDWWTASPDGRLVAYGTSQRGDEESTLAVRDVETGQDLADRIPRTRHCVIAWMPDGRSFFYTRHPAKGSVPEGEENYHRTVFLHRIGDDPAKDEKIFGDEGRPMTDSPSPMISPDGRWLAVQVHQGWGRSEVWLRDLRAPKAGFVPVATGVDALYDALPRNDTLWIRTNDGASRYRLYAVDPRAPERAKWRQVIAESDDVLESFAVVGKQIVVHWLHDVASRISRHSRDGKLLGDARLPALGASAGPTGRWDGDEAFFDFSSFALAPTVQRLDLRTGEVSTWDAVKADVDPSAYEVERVRARSKDGTEIPFFLVHRKGLAKDGKAPTVLTGYGGFDISLQPSFHRASYLLLEHGGVLAVANLRGGGERGEAWHRAGMLGKKQNVFDDAIAVAEKLVSLGWTDRDHLAISGGSNGGLLVGALITQRPELFRAAVCAVPLLDMIRYQRFLIAKLWVPEYGSSEDPAQFGWLWSYSPYHRVKEGTAYPAVLLTTAESDSRVDPMHARKMAAALQAATSSDRPVLLRVETRAGHGAGKPVTKLVDEQTDVWSFLFSQLSVPMRTTPL